MVKNWHISKARYDKKVNMVSEHRVIDFTTYDQGIEYLDQRQDEAIYLWHTNAVTLHNPMLAMVETENYRNEYNKIID